MVTLRKKQDMKHMKDKEKIFNYQYFENIYLLIEEFNPFVNTDN